MLDTLPPTQLIIPVGELLEATAMLSKVTPKKSTVAILQGIMFLGGGVIRATDLDCEVDYFVSDKTVHAPFWVDLPVLVKALKGADKAKLAHITFDGEMVTFEVDGLKSITSTHDPLDYPSSVEFENCLFSRTLDAAQFQSDLAFTAASVSTEETRYYLKGVFFTDYNKRLTMVSTDGHRLSKVETAASLNDGWKEASGRGSILPDMIAKLLVSTLGTKAKGWVRLSFYNTRMIITTEQWIVRTKLVDGTYPDWTRVVPSASHSNVNLDTAKLVKAATRLSGVAEGACLWIDTDGDISELSGDNGKHTMPLPAISGQGAVTVGLNGKYLLDVCKNLGGTALHLSSTGPSDPVRFTTPTNANRLMVVMPMRR